MLKPSINELSDRKGNRYKLCAAVSIRARRIIDGDEPMIDNEVVKPVSIAVNELNEDMFEIVESGDEEDY